jgi:hypothetical protein
MLTLIRVDGSSLEDPRDRLTDLVQVVGPPTKSAGLPARLTNRSTPEVSQPVPEPAVVVD